MTDMMNVESSMFTELGYEKKGEILLVRFSSGDLYAYHGVPETLWNELQAAYSMGSFFSKNIRNEYVYEKVDQGEN